MRWFKSRMLGMLAGLLLIPACITHQPRKTFNFNKPEASLEQIVEQELKVATVNIAGTRRANLNFVKVIYALLTGMDYTDRSVLEAYARFVDAEEIDILGLQEIELASQYMGYQNQAAIILSMADRMNYGIASAHFNTAILCSSVFNHGNAIIARYKLSEPEVEQVLDKVSWFSLDAAIYKSLDLLGGHKKILATSVTYHGSKGEETLYLINFHASTLARSLREEEMRILARYVAVHSPAIVMGDMNTTPKSEDGMLHERWKIYFNELRRLGIDVSVDDRYGFFNGHDVAPELYTSTSQNPHKAIDIIMAANKEGCKYRYSIVETRTVNVRTPDGSPASDHIAVVSVVRVE